MNIEQAAVTRVTIDTGKPWKRKGLRKELRRIQREIEDVEGEDAFLHPLHDMGMIPDAYWVDRDGGVVHLLEVEDTSLLTKDKLEKLVALFWAMDVSSDWSFALWICDRYGHHLRELDVFPYVYQELSCGGQ